jgi:opacity protein-like surface antigen
MNRISLTAAVFLSLLSAAAFADDLGKGSFEVRAAGGINASNRDVLGSPLPSFELQAAFGISKFFALTAGYTHDYLQDTGFGFFCLLPTPAACNQEFHNRIHEFMGGVRFSVPNLSPITPHLQFGMGAVRQTSDFSGFSRTEFGIAPGAGLDFKLSHHFGIGVDANFVKANRFTGFYHVMGGVFFRF